MKKLLLTLVSLAPGFALPAAVISPEVALQRMETSTMKKVMPELRPELVYTSSGKSGAAAYVFNYGDNGFVMLSADDLTTPVLGFSDSARFDPDDIPCGLRFWMYCYARRLDAVREDGYAAPIRKETAERESLDPAITTKWGQSEPFNRHCPKTEGKPCVTGCVATAMAQVLNLYRYDGKGEGIYSYLWKHFEADGPVDDELSYDFSALDFDWNNMLDVYTGDYSDTEADAVADLMLACGISVDMNYGTGASGAVAQFVPYALWKHFGFNAGIYTVERDCFRDPEMSWDDFVYSQIREHGAVLYNGVTSANEGHAFVCDGYREGGYFHFNWGWNGLSDGWFRLDALDPEVQGTGGSANSYAFNYQQNIHAFVSPGAEGESWLPSICGRDDSFNVTAKNASLGKKVKVTGSIINCSQLDYTLDFGCLLTDSEWNNEGQVLPVTSFDLESCGAKTIYNNVVFPEDIEEGIYCMRPVITWDGLGYWWSLPWNVKKDHVWIQVKEGMVYFNIDPETAGMTLMPDDPDTDSTTEYYTLQGVKILKPERGRIYIRVSESGATKIIY